MVGKKIDTIDQAKAASVEKGILIYHGAMFVGMIQNYTGRHFIGTNVRFQWVNHELFTDMPTHREAFWELYLFHTRQGFSFYQL